MSKSKTNKINYLKMTLFIVILVLLFAIIQFEITTKNNKLSSTENNTLDLNVNTVQTAKENNNIVENSIKNVSKAIPLNNGKKSNNSLAVLMYHYFYDASKGENGKNANYMEISKFEEQLKYLSENDYYYPTWQEVEDFVNGKIDLPKKSVVITMDDGKDSVFKLAVPILDKYKIPATAFIITKNFDENKLKTYKNSMIDFQSHTDNMHRAGGSIGHGGIFPALSVEEGVEDLKTSIRKLDGNSDALAYPYGDNTPTTWKAVKQAGFKLAFTTENKKVKPGMNQYALPRVRMYKDITIKGFINSL